MKIIFGIAIAVFALTSTVFAAPIHDQWPLIRLTVGRGRPSTTSGVQRAAADNRGRTWYLGPHNTTTKIDAAYRYGNYIVIFGWNGLAGLNTIIDAVSGREHLEFLGYLPQITQNGVVVFEQFYPHFTEPDIVSNYIRALDLNKPIPANVPRQYELPIANVGYILYPRTVSRGERHIIAENFLVSKSGREVFIIDRPTPTLPFCFVRVSLQSFSNTPQKKYCIPSLTLTGYPDEATSIAAVNYVGTFRQNQAGNLTFVVAHGETARPEKFRVDPNTLLPTKLPPSNAALAPFRMPWKVEKSGLIKFVALDVHSAELSPYAGRIVKILIIIDKSGGVSNVTVVGIPKGLAQLIKSAILSWKFKPNMLDGALTDVSTEFTTTIGKLDKVPE